MKRFFEHEHRLSAEEREAIWAAIAGEPRRQRREAGAERARRPWPIFASGGPLRPGRLVLATGVTAVAAIAVAVMLREPEAPRRIVAEATRENSAGPIPETAARVSPPEAEPGAVADVAEAPAVAIASEPAHGAERAPGVAETRPVDLAREKAASAPAAAAPAMAAALAGVVVDATTGDTLRNAEVTIVRADGAEARRDGDFTLAGLAPGQAYGVRVRHLGYADLDTTLTLDADTLQVALALAPVLVATLSAVDVEGQKYMVEVKNAPAEQTFAGDKFQKYALRSVEESVAKDSRAVMRAGELYLRGGRDSGPGGVTGAAPTRAPSQANSQAPSPDWRRRVWTPPNDAAFDAMFFQHYGVNPFVITEEDALSTFALDVDDASFSVTRRYLGEGHLPPPEAVRVEEFVNAFDQGVAAPRDGDFRIQVDGAPSPYGQGYHLLRVALRGRVIPEADRRPARLVFVIDTSGSMAREDRLGTVKQALRMLIDELRPEDTVGIVVYGSRGQVVLEPTSLEERRRIEAAIDGLAPSGSTNAEEGLDLAYAMARRQLRRGDINRLILCSDGVANQGRTSAEAILDRVRREADEGIQLTTVGFGMGNYNDVLMEKLADKGDGSYHYVDDLDAARRVFRENLTGLLQTIAEEAKIQVEFDPRRVSRWRLLGYENRDVADEDFRNDRIDAGEIGAGHQVAALYEIKLAGPDERRGGRPGGRPEDRLGTVRLRYRVPRTADRGEGRTLELERGIALRDLGGQRSGSFERAAPRLRLAAVAAEFAEILRHSYWARGSRLADLALDARRLARELPDDPAVRELAQMIDRAAALEEPQEIRPPVERDDGPAGPPDGDGCERRR